MTYFPFFENIEGKCFLIVGGGAVAAEKTARLRGFTDRVTVIAPETEISGVTVKKKSFSEEDLEDADYCICATDDHRENIRIAALCREKGIPVNVADDPALCSFIFPALIKRGDLIVGISTSGSSPAYAACLRSQLEQIIPDHIEQVLDQMGALRSWLANEVPDAAERKELYRKVLAKLLASDGSDTEEDVRRIVYEYKKD